MEAIKQLSKGLLKSKKVVHLNHVSKARSGLSRVQARYTTTSEAIATYETQNLVPGTDFHIGDNFQSLEGVELTEEERKLVTEFENEVIVPQQKMTKDVATINLLQRALGEYDYFERVAKELGKTIYELTDVELVKHRLDQREKFVSDVELDQVVLFSNQKTLEKFGEFKKSFLSLWTPSNPPPSWVTESIALKEAEFVKYAENEYVEEFVVDQDVYDRVKERLFPTLLDKDVSAEDIIDYQGGYNRTLLPSSNPSAKPFVDLIAQLKDPKTNEETKNATLKQLLEALGGSEHYNPSVALTNTENIDKDASIQPVQEGFFSERIQKHASNKLSEALGRFFKPGDVHPEKRLEAGSLDVYHPLLEKERSVYLYGESSEPDMFADEKYPVVKFTPKDHFNPPNHWRPIPDDFRKENPKLIKDLQVAALDFSYFEGEEVGNPISAGEHIVKMKMWKLYNYLIPQVGKNPEQKKNFLNHFDISPGEMTLEWCLSFPPQEHTFLEYPMWTAVYEVDEVDPPVMWPYYHVRTIETKVFQSIENIDDKDITLKLLGDLAGNKAAAKEIATEWKKLNKEERIELLQYISPYYQNKTITDEDIEDVSEATDLLLQNVSPTVAYNKRLELIDKEMREREESEDVDMIDATAKGLDIGLIDSIERLESKEASGDEIVKEEKAEEKKE